MNKSNINEYKYQKQLDVYHAKLLKSFESKEEVNLRIRISKIKTIVNNECRSLSSSLIQFEITQKLFNEMLLSIKPEISEHTRVQSVKMQTRINNENQYKKPARNMLNRWKPAILGNHVLHHIIFIELYNHCYRICRLNNEDDADILRLFINIFDHLLSETVKFPQARPLPLIFHAIFDRDNQFKKACIKFLKHFNVIQLWDQCRSASRAEDRFKSFRDCLKQINSAQNRNAIVPIMLNEDIMSVNEHNQSCSIHYIHIIRRFIIYLEAEDRMNKIEKISNKSVFEMIINQIGEFHHHRMEFFTINTMQYSHSYIRSLNEINPVEISQTASKRSNPLNVISNNDDNDIEMNHKSMDQYEFYECRNNIYQQAVHNVHSQSFHSISMDISLSNNNNVPVLPHYHSSSCVGMRHNNNRNYTNHPALIGSHHYNMHTNNICPLAQRYQQLEFNGFMPQNNNNNNDNTNNDTQQIPYIEACNDHNRTYNHLPSNMMNNPPRNNPMDTDDGIERELRDKDGDIVTTPTIGNIDLNNNNNNNNNNTEEIHIPSQSQQWTQMNNHRNYVMNVGQGTDNMMNNTQWNDHQNNTMDTDNQIDHEQRNINNDPVGLEYDGSSQWKCAVCTYQNNESCGKCSMCGLPKKPAGIY